MAGRWSVAWRVFDAQWWGVPQRRRRIALVADFGGNTAHEILFECKSVSGDFAESGKDGERASDGTQDGAGETECYPINTQIITRNNKLGRSTGFGLGENGAPAYTLQAGHEHGVCVSAPLDGGGVLHDNRILYANFEQLLTNINGKRFQRPPVCDSEYRKLIYTIDRESFSCGYNYKRSPGISSDGINPTLISAGVNAVAYNEKTKEVNYEAFISYERHTALTSGGGQAGQGYPCVLDARGNGDGSVVPTLTGDHENRITDYTAITFEKSDAVDCRNATENTETNGTFQAKSSGEQSLNLNNVVRNRMIVRRLTPLECERLQGFDDNWTNIPAQTLDTDDDINFWRKVWSVWSNINGAKPKSDKAINKWLNSPVADSARYRMLGNSIALPSWEFVLGRISKQYNRPATMASLFDGIGGFPKIWEAINGDDSCIWASEVDPEPIRVTKYRFKEIYDNE